MANGFKPFRGAHINPAHPLSRGLVSSFLMNEYIGDYIFDSGGRYVGDTWDGSLPPTWDAGGVRFNGTGTVTANHSAIVTNLPSLRISSKGTLFLRIRADVSQPNFTWFISDSANLNGFSIYRTTSDGKYAFVWGGGTDIMPTAPATDIADGAAHTLCITWDASNETKVYIDGVLEAQDTVSRTPTPTGSIRFGSRQSDDRYSLRGVWECANLYNEILSAANIAALHSDPYQMYEATSPGRFISVAGGGVTVTPAKAALSWTGKAVSANETQSIQKLQTSWTGKDVTTISDVVIAPAKAAFTWAGQAASANETNRIDALTTTWTGKNLSVTDVVLIAKMILTWTGKRVIVTGDAVGRVIGIIGSRFIKLIGG